MKVIIKPSGKIIHVEGKYSVKKLLEKLNMNPEEFLVTRNGELLTRDEIITNEDEVIIIPVISGGRQ